jgi:hypothetical protein
MRWFVFRGEIVSNLRKRDERDEESPRRFDDGQPRGASREKKQEKTKRVSVIRGERKRESRSQ